jgi:hypothetical protein
VHSQPRQKLCESFRTCQWFTKRSHWNASISDLVQFLDLHPLPYNSCFSSVVDYGLVNRCLHNTTESFSQLIFWILGSIILAVYVCIIHGVPTGYLLFLLSFCLSVGWLRRSMILFLFVFSFLFS